MLPLENCSRSKYCVSVVVPSYNGKKTKKRGSSLQSSLQPLPLALTDQQYSDYAGRIANSKYILSIWYTCTTPLQNCGPGPIYTKQGFTHACNGPVHSIHTMGENNFSSCNSFLCSSEWFGFSVSKTTIQVNPAQVG